MVAMTAQRQLFFTLLIACVSGALSNVSTHTTLTSGSSGENPTEAANGEADAERTAMAQLINHIKELSETTGKAPPLVRDGTGKLKVIVDTNIIVTVILGVDDVQQIMQASLLIMLHWMDKSLAWNASEFDGVNFVEVPLALIWTPNLGVANYLDYKNVLNLDGNVAIVQNTGWVFVRSTLTTETMCSMDLTYYPFDQQTCSIYLHTFSKFITWDTKEDEPGTYLFDVYGASAEWERVETSTFYMHFQEYDEGGPVVNVTIKRKTTFYTVCLILPMVVTSYMNTLVFLLPLQSGEKISFLVSIFVSNSVFVSYFTNVMPRGLNDVPHTMQLLIGVIVESVVVLLATIVVLMKFHSQTRAASHPDGSSGAPDNVQEKGLKSCERGGSPKVGSAGRALLCYGKKSRVHVVQPAPGNQSQKHTDNNDDDTNLTTETEVRGSSPTAEQLDRVFFVLFFVSNTIFMASPLLKAVLG